MNARRNVRFQIPLLANKHISGNWIRFPYARIIVYDKSRRISKGFFLFLSSVEKHVFVFLQQVFISFLNQHCSHNSCKFNFASVLRQVRKYKANIEVFVWLYVMKLIHHFIFDFFNQLFEETSYGKLTLFAPDCIFEQAA